MKSTTDRADIWSFDRLAHSEMAMETQPPFGFDNRISLQKLEVFLLVVELGGIGRAADHLNVSQPVVTAHMRTLQERVGAKLIYRDGQQMRLTEMGEAVHDWAKEVLTRSREVARQIQGLADGAAGTAVVASSMSVGSYMLPDIVSAFVQARPRASITLLVSDAEDAKAAAERGDADFAIVTSDSQPEEANLQAEAICDHDLILVAAPNDAHVGDVVTVDGLAGLRYVCSPSGRPRRRLVDTAMAAIGVRDRRIAIQLGHPEALKSATAYGLGVCLMLRSSVSGELDAGILREVAIEDAHLTVPIVLIRRTDKRFSPLQSVLMATICETLVERFGASTAAPAG
jgi:LysR family transcriptional regulator, low CO2-responsive transcriptional regulator